MANPLMARIAERTEYDEQARYINQVKEDSVDLEFFDLVRVELEFVERAAYQELLTATGDTATRIAGFLAGVCKAREAIYRIWPVDDETEEKETEDNA